jgi:hypothetical protein
MDVIFLERTNPTLHQKTNKPRQGVGRSVAKSIDRFGDTHAQLLHLTRQRTLYTFYGHTESIFGLEIGSCSTVHF